MLVWNVLYAARWKCRTQKSPKNRHLGTIAQICRAISPQLRHISTIEKKLLNSNVSPTCRNNMVNFSSLAAAICWRVWDTPPHFSGFRVLAALLHGTLVVSVSQTLRVEQRAPPISGRAAITLGIGPHSSFVLVLHDYLRSHCYDRFNAMMPVFAYDRFDEIWHGDAVWPSWAFRLLKFTKFENPRWQWPPSWKIEKSPYPGQSLTITPF